MASVELDQYRVQNKSISLDHVIIVILIISASFPNKYSLIWLADVAKDGFYLNFANRTLTPHRCRQSRFDIQSEICILLLLFFALL